MIQHTTLLVLYVCYAIKWYLFLKKHINVTKRSLARLFLNFDYSPEVVLKGALVTKGVVITDGTGGSTNKNTYIFFSKYNTLLTVIAGR